MAQLSERTLKSATAGNRTAFRKVYEAYFDGLWRYIYVRCGDREQTADIVSESFVALYQSIRSITYPRAVRSYLYRIARNCWLAEAKKSARRKEVLLPENELELAAQTTGQVTNFRDKENDKSRLAKIALRLLKRLKKEYREVLMLRYLSGLKYREIAEQVGKTVNNVKVIHSRALSCARRIAIKDEISI